MNKTRLITLSGNGLGYISARCRWVNMGGGVYQWVCFSSGGGDNPTGIFTKNPNWNPSATMLGTAAQNEPGFVPKQKQYPQVPPDQSVNIMSWIKENLILAGVIVVGAYLIMKK